MFCLVAFLVGIKSFFLHIDAYALRRKDIQKQKYLNSLQPTKLQWDQECCPLSNSITVTIYLIDAVSSQRNRRKHVHEGEDGYYGPCYSKFDMTVKTKTGVWWKKLLSREILLRIYVCICVFLMLILSTTVFSNKCRFYRRNVSKWHLISTCTEYMEKNRNLRTWEKGFWGSKTWTIKPASHCRTVHCRVVDTCCWCPTKYYHNNLPVNLCLKPTFFVYGKVTYLQKQQKVAHLMVPCVTISWRQNQ